MIFAGVTLKRPEFWALTRAIGFAIALWTVLTLSPLGAKDAVGAGANLLAVVFGCVSNEFGIEVRRGGRHLALNIAVCTVVLILYHWLAAAFV
ncbi:hypothetical protein [Delftia acidovorans]|uniref:hypothetical protein n=1 Tax=Delftia acidovorans TaxID=80866 RepID=UPI0022AB9AC9|nr:hypothetical protein [Delftia acidovorans]WAT88370.1 hypothetical protein O1V13_14300 [Delftia acidovorans]